MKRIFKIIFVIILTLCLTSCLKENKNTKKVDNKNTKEKETKELTEDEMIEEKLNKMSLDEKIGQMFIVANRTPNIDDDLNNILNTIKPGGFILFGENITNYNNTLNYIKTIKSSNKDIPLFIMIDEEGGTISRLKKLEDKITQVPNMYNVGSKNDLELTRKVGNVLGRQLSVFGINTDTAPDIDTVTNPNNNVIGKRAFSSNYDIVANNGVALAQGLKDYNITPIYKHFPGHGSTSTDSHTGLPIITKTKEELLNEDLQPFKKAIENNAQMIMIGHLAVPSITNDNTPATMSKELVTDLLKNELGFNGLVITDAINMGALTKNYELEEIYEKIINAGNDLLLYPNDPIEEFNIVKKLVKNNIISEERVDESVRKILKYKEENIKDNYNKYLDKSNLNSQENIDIINSITN